MLTQVSGELALLKQATELGTKATDARFDGIARAIEVLSGKLDRVIEGQTEPGASPAGRAMLEKITAAEKAIVEHEVRLDGFAAFETTVLSSFRTLRAQMTIIGLVIGIASGITAVATFAGNHGP